MKRNLQKAVQDYKAKYYTQRNTHNEGAFYACDIDQIAHLATRADGTICVFTAIGHALEAGFMVGYRKAVRDAKKRQKRNM